MIINNLALPAHDGITLAGTLYQAKPDINKAILINAGTGILRRYCDAFAQFLGGQGFSVVTFDYRGIGDSRPPNLRGYSASMREWGEKDIASIIAWITANLRPTKLFIIGFFRQTVRDTLWRETVAWMQGQ